MPIGFAKSVLTGTYDNTPHSSIKSTNNGSTSNGAGIVVNYNVTQEGAAYITSQQSSADGSRAGGTYNAVATTTDGSGSGFTMNITVNSSSGAIESWPPASYGQGYEIGDRIYVADSELGSGGAAQGAFTVTHVYGYGGAVDSRVRQGTNSNQTNPSLVSFWFKGQTSDLHSNKQAVVGWRWREGGDQVTITNTGIVCERHVDTPNTSDWDGSGNPIYTGDSNTSITQACTPTDFATNFLDNNWHHCFAIWGDHDDRSAPFNESGCPNVIHLDGVVQTLSTNNKWSSASRITNYVTGTPPEAKSENIYCLMEPPTGSDSTDFNNNNNAYNDVGVGTVKFAYIWYHPFYNGGAGLPIRINNNYTGTFTQPTPIPQPGGDLARQFYDNGWVQLPQGGHIRWHKEDSSVAWIAPKLYLRSIAGTLTNRDGVQVSSYEAETPSLTEDGHTDSVAVVNEGSGTITTSYDGPTGS